MKGVALILTLLAAASSVMATVTISPAASAGLEFRGGPDGRLEVLDSGGTGAVAAILGVSESPLHFSTELWVTNDLTAQLRIEEDLGFFDMSAIGRVDLGSMNLWLIGWGVAGDRPAGTYAGIETSTGKSWGDVNGHLGTAVLLDADTYEQIDVAYLLVPEPLTLGLLGVGALFLRRRNGGSRSK